MELKWTQQLVCSVFVHFSAKAKYQIYIHYIQMKVFIGNGRWAIVLRFGHIYRWGCAWKVTTILRPFVWSFSPKWARYISLWPPFLPLHLALPSLGLLVCVWRGGGGVGVCVYDCVFRGLNLVRYMLWIKGKMNSKWFWRKAINGLRASNFLEVVFHH